jgi:hypothetical protein
MRTLSVQRNEAKYTGLYVEPPFALWGEGARILEGLYRAFRPFGVTLADIRGEHGTGSVADEAVAVYIGGQASFRFTFDRVEASVSNPTDADLDSFADLVSFGETWLRTAAPTLRFSSHLLSYACHGSIEGMTSAAFLSQFATPAIAAFGEGRGNAITWHGKIDQGQVQLTADHSIAVSNGLFLQFILITLGDVINYKEHFTIARDKFTAGLRELGLELRNESG